MAHEDEETLVRRLREAGCVFAEEEARLLLAAADGREARSELVERRLAGEPLEQVLGWVEFCGHRVIVGPGVFVPRKRTALLVDVAVEELATSAHPRPVVVDLCCGSGAIGLVVAARLRERRREVELHATDHDPRAVACARQNLAPINAQVHHGDLQSSLPTALRGRVQVLIANVPYVPTGAIAALPPEARDHEPLAALDGGADGLDVVRRVAALAPQWLAVGGSLLVETGHQQSRPAAEEFSRAGLAPRIVDWDYTCAIVGRLVSSRSGR